MSDIFISYKADDRARVKPLVDAFLAEGLTVWWDVHIEGGAAWRARIQRELDAAGCVVVVWTVNSTGPAGHFVQDEASRARRRGVYLPVALDAVEAPLGFGQEHVLKLIDWRGNRRDPRFQDVLALARAIVAGGPRPAPEARARAAGARRPALGLWTAVGVGVFVALGGLTVIGGPSRMCAAVGLPCGGGAARPTAPPTSIAVLPFANISGDRTQDYFADGLSEELIATLSRIAPLQVVGRTSAFKFKGSKEDSAAIGAKLGVAYLLDGSVRRDGDLVRVSAQLVEARTGFERWSQTYDRPMKDVLSIQTDIAGLVGDALRVKMLGVAAADGSADPVAHEAYLRGRQLYNLGGDEATFRGALAQFDAAIAADPAYALAHAARARALIAIANQFARGADVQALYDAGVKSAERAVELGPDLALAQSVLGFARLYGRLDIQGAALPYQRAWRLGQGDPDILFGYGAYESQVGRSDLALAALRRAAVLDPLNPRAGRELGLALYAARRFPEAIAAFHGALALSPRMNYAHGYIGHSLLAQGRTADALEAYRAEPEPAARLAGTAIAERRLGDTAAAEAALARLTAELGDSALYQRAEVLTQWGRADAAVDALEQAYGAGDSGLLQLKTDPLLDPLRALPRFKKLLQTMNFP